MWAYEQRIRDIKHATFTPLVLSATGGLGNEANTFYKRLASLLATKWNNPYSSTMLAKMPTLSSDHQSCLLEEQGPHVGTQH